MKWVVGLWGLMLFWGLGDVMMQYRPTVHYN